MDRIRKIYQEVNLETGEIIKDTSRIEVDDGLVLFDSSTKFVKVYAKTLMKYVNKLESIDTMVMMSLLNNISYETCMLTKTGTNDRRYILTHSDVEDITGLSYKTVSRVMNRLVKAGLLARVKFKNTYIYYANPYLFLKGNKVSKAILDIFKEV